MIVTYVTKRRVDGYVNLFLCKSTLFNRLAHATLMDSKGRCATRKALDPKSNSCNNLECTNARFKIQATS